MTSDIGKTRVSFQRFTLRLSLACFVLLFTPVHADLVPGQTEPALGTYHWPNGTAGVDAFAATGDRDMRAFFLTDFLVRQFDTLVIKGVPKDCVLDP